MGEVQSLQRDSHAALSMAASFKRGIGGKIWLSGGADRDRTDDLLNAIQTLYQLSYGPVR